MFDYQVLEESTPKRTKMESFAQSILPSWLSAPIQNTEPTTQTTNPTPETKPQGVGGEKPATQTKTTPALPQRPAPKKRGTIKTSVNLGSMGWLKDLLEEHGISGTITSGLREGATTKQGRRSHHADGNAIDFVPTGSYEALEETIRQSPELVDALRAHGIGVLREVGKDSLAFTGGTGDHFHFGPDHSAVEDLNRLLNKQTPYLLRGAFNPKFKLQSEPPLTQERVTNTLAEQAGLAPKGERAPDTFDEDEFRLRQAWMESSFNPLAVNQGSGATGLFQITPVALKEYQRIMKNKGEQAREGELTDPEFASHVRDVLWNAYDDNAIVKKASNPIVKAGIKAGMYNWGGTNFRKALSQAQALGHDVYGSLSWMDDPTFLVPEETRNYIRFGVLGEDRSKHLNNKAYEKAKAGYLASNK